MSQTSLGKVLGVTFQQVQKYEKGINRIGAGRLQQIANVMNVTVPYFFENCSSQASQRKLLRESIPVAELDSFVTGVEGRALAKAFTRIESGPVRRAIRRLVDQIAEGSRSVTRWRARHRP